MLPPVPITPPVELPVSRAEAKLHCRVPAAVTAEDDTFDEMISAAVAHLDGWHGVLGRCLVTQRWRQDYPDWRPVLHLPFPDVAAASVVVSYRDEDNVEQTVSDTLYEVIEGLRGPAVHFLDDFTDPSVYDDKAYPVSIAFDAGFGDAAAVPPDLKLLIKQMVSTWYWNRETAIAGSGFADTPHSHDAVVARYRRVMS
jgi:uncharacterized phiE125 gp8 family phage protein